MGRRQGEGLDRRSPSAFSFAARTQHRGVIVAARRTQCCTQASRRAGVPDRGGTQGPGSLSPPKCSFSAVGWCWYLRPSSAGSAVQYLGTGTDGCCSSSSSKAPPRLTDTHTSHAHTHRETEWSVRRTCPRYPSTTRRSLSIYIVAHKLPPFPLPGTPARQRT